MAVARAEAEVRRGGRLRCVCIGRASEVMVRDEYNRRPLRRQCDRHGGDDKTYPKPHLTQRFRSEAKGSGDVTRSVGTLQHFLDPPSAVQNDRGREADDPVSFCDAHPGSAKARKGPAIPVDEGESRVSVVLPVHPDQRRSAAQLARQALERRRLRSTGLAPACPEVDRRGSTAQRGDCRLGGDQHFARQRRRGPAGARRSATAIEQRPRISHHGRHEGQRDDRVCETTAAHQKGPDGGERTPTRARPADRRSFDPGTCLARLVGLVYLQDETTARRRRGWRKERF
jgi:hypothetical protein